MHLQWNKKYTTIAVYALIVIVLSIILINFLWKTPQFEKQFSNFFAIMMPFIIGAGLAYAINFILRFYEEKVFTSLKKHKRKVSILFSYVTVILILLLILQVLVPQLTQSVLQFVEGVPEYTNALTAFIDGIFDRLRLSDNMQHQLNERIRELVETFTGFVGDIAPVFLKSLISIATSATNLFLGFVVSIYLLTEKERFGGGIKRLCYTIFKNAHARGIIRLFRRADRIFGRYLRGILIDALIVGAMTTISMLIFQIPYAVLIGFLVGISNTIPYFGPFIGAIPSALIVFFVDPIKALWFLVLILVIQQIDGNFIAPKILGESIGLSPFWVLFSTLVFGSLFGIPGMILGVPVFAFLLSIINNLIEMRLRQKSLPVEPEAYMD
ncbi:MAG: AI-2E family transporter [Turicibacter sp.]|nr:AI-2E family transporter [Turicibacter sp.]